ncbi:MAG: DNA-binding response regulator [Bacteroidia bacterium]|nr:DNA-binding response regulator [Bacteroidia bacterium]
MNRFKILIVTNDKKIAEEINRSLSDFDFEIILTLCVSEYVISEIEKNKFELIIIDFPSRGYSQAINIGKYIIENCSISFAYLIDESQYGKTFEIIETRPNAIIFKPINNVHLHVQVLLLKNRRMHFKLDVSNPYVEQDNEIPFQINKIISYIQNNIKSNIQINELAEISPWSYDYFIKTFKKYLNKTPYNYILSKKIEIAKYYLSTTSLPISEIAIILSFESYSNFFIAFKKEAGCTPKEFRNRLIVQKLIEKRTQINTVQ